jgi:CubicO group peptidase (beta-lactamase class C family)
MMSTVRLLGCSSAVLLSCSSAVLLSCSFAALPAAAASGPEAASYASNLRRKVLLDGAGDQRFGIEERMRHYGVPPVSVAIVEGCRVVDARGFGQATPEGGAVHPGTRFMAGSVSKVVASAGRRSRT